MKASTAVIGVGIFTALVASIAIASARKAAPTAPTPANITPTAATATSSTAGEIDINITWTNTGEQAGSFVPKASIDGGAPIDLGVGTITLAPGATYNAAIALFGAGITPGAHTVCPVPN